MSEEVKNSEAPATTESQAVPETKIKTRDDYIAEGAQIIIDALDSSDNTPKGMIERFFEANASDELKSQCKSDGKSASDAWKYLQACVRHADADTSHARRIDAVSDAIGLAVAMHYFQDVPVNYNSLKPVEKSKPKPSEEKPAPKKSPAKKSQKKPAEKSEPKKSKPKKIHIMEQENLF